MKVLVTGGAGFIGSHLVDRLVADRHEVVVFDNLFRGKLENIREHIDHNRIIFLKQDIRNYDQVKQACAGCEVVFHLAAQSNVMGAVEDIRYSFSANVIGTFNVLEAAKEQNVRRLIFSSSREAYGEAQYLPVDEKHPLESKNSYGASKAAGEKYCQVFQNSGDLEVIILRLANVYGLRDFNRVIPIFFDNVKNQQDINIFGGEQVIDFIAVPDVVEIMIQSINNTAALSGPTNIGSGQGTTLFELANSIMQLFGNSSRLNVQSPRSAEVVKYTANISRLKEIFDINLAADPLYYLKKMR